jgi:two-component system sensor histidine kinase FlrB
LDKSLQNTLSLGSKTTDTPNLTSKTDAAQSLEKAFALFVEESKKLEQQQTELQAKINLLSSELTASNQRISALIKAMPAGAVLLENQIVKEFNHAATQFFPYLKADQLFAIPPHWEPSITPGEYLIQSPGVSQNNQTVQVIQIEEGFRTIIQIQDITQNILSHQKSQQESRLTAMGKMSANIAHQFRTPLATALLYSSHLCDLELDDTNKKEFAQRLRKQLLGLEMLSKEMLYFVSNRPKQMRLVRMDELLLEADQAIRPLCDAKDVQLQAVLQTKNLRINAEKFALVNAFIAILENALKVSSQGQSIQITTVADKHLCKIQIQDQGPGIPEDLLDSLFEPFLSGHSTGTGLGLAIAKNVIEAHRGNIHADNTPTGARFTITLPCINEL